MRTFVHALCASMILLAPSLPAQDSGGGNTSSVQANVSLTVDVSSTAGPVAHAHVEFLDYYAVRSQAAPWTDSLGRIILDATVEPVAVIAVYPPPPKPVVDLTYRLGPLPAGSHEVLFRMNGKVFAAKTFTVPGPTPPPVEVTLQVVTTTSGSLLKARVVFPDGYWHLDDPGVPLRNGTEITIDARANRIETLVPPSGPAVFEPQYPLGVLPAGAYSVIYRINGAVTAEYAFSVGEPALPQLSFIHFRQGDVSMAAEVGVTVPSGVTVTGWGEVLRDGNVFKVALTFGPATAVNDPAATSPGQLLRHVYSLGVVEPGAYRMVVSDASGGRILGSREFTVGPLPPPPPPPTPIVAYIHPWQGLAGWFVEVGLGIPRPDIVITDWGVPVRDGNRISVAIKYGKAPVPVMPYDPVAGGSTVFSGPIPAADEPPSVVDPAISGGFNQVCGWPVKLLRHRYELGVLEPGAYGFVVSLNGRDAAKRGFVVPDPVKPGPVATLYAPALEMATAEPYRFRIVFNAPAGWSGEPGQGKVTVNGPDGFSGIAELVSTIPSLDPLGRLFDCTYALTGPDGAWDARDNGNYRVCVDPAAVVDRNGNTVPEPCIGEFRVRIRPDLPPVPPELAAKVDVEMRDGKWFAKVAFENTGNWFACDWGPPRIFGNVFAASAVLRPLPPGSLAPIPASFVHSYPLGSPPPGVYGFVFRSSAGHCARARFVVPGVEPPTPVEAWAIISGCGCGPGLDDDRDGWPNLAEYFLCMRPLAADQPPFRPKVVTRGGRRQFAIEFKRLHGVEAPLRIGVEVSRDLVTWRDAGDLVDWIALDPDPDGTQAVEVIQKPEIGAKEWPFMRMRVDEPSSP